MARFSTLTLVALLFTLPLDAAVTGRVLDEDGKPIRGARIRVRAPEAYEQDYTRVLSKDPLPVWIETVETNDSGVFRIDTKSNAVVELMAEAPGRQFFSQDVANGDEMTIVLRKGAVHRGRITGAGKPVAGAVIAIGRSYVTRSDAGGNFESPEPAVTDRIRVIHPDYAITDRPLRDRDKPSAEMSFDVALKPGTVLRGRVVDSAGRAVAGAVVRVGWWPLARSGEDGSFEIAHAPAEKPALFVREGNRAGSLYTDRVKPPYVIQLRPAATVNGTVRNNKDEVPVPGARVGVRGDLVDGWFPSAISDAKGNFVIDGIDAGTRRVFVSHPAFFGGNNELRFEEAARLSRILYVTPLAKLAGKVIDEENKPVVVARVSLVGIGANTMTAPDGTFSLRFPSFERALSVAVQKAAYAPASYGPYMVEPGETKSGLQFRLTRGTKLEIRLIDRDGAPIAREPVAVTQKTDARFMRTPLPCGSSDTPGCRSDEEGRVAINIADGTYDIVAGGETTVRRDLPNQTLDARSSPLTIELERGAVVEGRVVWSDGAPLTINAMVTTTTNPPASAPVTEGAFSLRNVPAGKLTLVAEGAPPSFVKGEPLEIIAPASGVTLKVPRNGRIEGRVVERDTEKPVREFSMVLQQTGMRGRTLPPKPFRADDGRFALEDVAPGVYELRVQASGFMRANSTSVTVEESKTASAAITLDRGATVVGRVTSEGRPLADVSVSMPSPDFRAVLPQVMTDSNGEFTLDGVPSGMQRFEARRQGYAAKTVGATVAPAPKETRVDIELSRGREVRGRVIDSNGQPVAQVEVMARSMGAPGSGMVMTDGEGAFKMGGLSDQKYTLVTRKDGFAEATVEVNPATTSEVTITLSRGGTITGRILGLAPADFPFVNVRAARSVTSVQPDAGGNFTLTGVPDGEVLIFASVSRPRMRSVQERVTVTNGMAPPVDLDFSSGISVRGRVTQQGQLVEGNISFLPLPRGPALITTSEIARDGMYEVRVAAPGEYEVMVHRFMGGSINAGRVTVAGDMVHDIELRGTKVTGLVVDATTRQPIVNAAVMLLPGNQVFTNGVGRFTFDLVGDGKYSVRAQAEGYAPAVSAFEVTNGSAPGEIELALSRGLAAQFRIVDAATGQPADITGVAVSDPSKAPMYYGNPETDATGMRRVLLQPGTYELRVFAQGYALKAVMLTVPGPPLDVRLERAAKP